MTRPRLLAPSLLGPLALAAALTLAPLAVVATPARAAVPSAPDDGPANTFFSSPGAVVAPAAPPPAAAERRAEATKRPKPPRTKGTVVGQVVGPEGTPIRHALVAALRFSDLGNGPDPGLERRVLTRTDGQGRFTLKQFREPYLVRVCSESTLTGDGTADRSGDCDQTSAKRFTPSYVGPDGTLNSWMRQTRMFTPQQPRRSLGRVVVQPPAVLSGVFKDSADEGANTSGKDREVQLTRIDGSVAATTQSDDKGHYRFEVAPGPYRLTAERDPGLTTQATVPGYRSHRLVLRAGRTTHLDFKTRHAGIVRGLVTSGGVPLANQYLAVIDSTGTFAAGVVTNSIGRYVISSLEPGTYSVTTSFAGSSYVPVQQGVTVAQKSVATADFALDPGRSVTFTPQDTVFAGANGSVDAELRNATGQVVKFYQGAPTAITFAGLPNGSYRLLVRRSNVTPGQVDFPYADQVVDLNAGTGGVTLLPVVLATPTVNLTGALPPGSQVKLTELPADSWLAPAYVAGDQSFPMASGWTVPGSGGGYTVRGTVPGTYVAVVTTALRQASTGATSTVGDVATTRSQVIVDGPAPVVNLTAPTGAIVRGRFEYGNKRPAIAPFGLRVTDTGDQSAVFPAVSGTQAPGKGFRVKRLHAGPAEGRLLDLDALHAEDPSVLVPDDLVDSARDEPGTPYWYTSGRKSFTLTAGATENLGLLRLRLHGVLGR